MPLLIDPALAIEETFTVPGSGYGQPLAANGRAGQQVAGPTAHPAGSGWNPEAHPRGAHGHFAAKGDGYGGDGPHENVRQLQSRLNDVGHQVQKDGQFGVHTEAAVSAFQAKYGLEQTGKVDAATLSLMRNPPPVDLAQALAGKKAVSAAARAVATSAALTHASAKATATVAAQAKVAAKRASNPKAAGGQGGLGTAPLKLGEGMGQAKVGSVQNLQALLASLGFDVGADGRFGPETEAAVKKLQAKYGLKTDGVVGPETKALLLRLQKQAAKSQAKGPDSIASITAAAHRDGEPDLEEQILSDGWGLQPSRSIIDFRPQGDPLSDLAIWDQRTGSQAQDVRPGDAQAPVIEPPYGELDTDDDREPARPPNYRPTSLVEGVPGNQICAACTRFDGSNTCLGWNWLVDRTGVCDAYDSLADRLGARIQESVEQRKVASTGSDFAVARAREQTLRHRLEEMFGYNHTHAEGAWRDALHPRTRTGEFADVLGKLQNMRGGSTLQIGDHHITKRNSGDFTVRSGGQTLRADAPSAVAEHITSSFASSAVSAPQLPENHADYFDLSAQHDHRIVPIASLTADEPDPEGTLSAVEYMQHVASSPTEPKLAPLTAIPNANGGHSIVNGTATLQAARQNGWSHIPIKVESQVRTIDGRLLSVDHARREQTDYTSTHGQPSPYLPGHIEPYPDLTTSAAKGKGKKLKNKTSGASEALRLKDESRTWRPDRGSRPGTNPPVTRWAHKNLLISPALAGGLPEGRTFKGAYVAGSTGKYADLPKGKLKHYGVKGKGFGAAEWHHVAPDGTTTVAGSLPELKTKLGAGRETRLGVGVPKAANRKGAPKTGRAGMGGVRTHYYEHPDGTILAFDAPNSPVSDRLAVNAGAAGGRSLGFASRDRNGRVSLNGGGGRVRA